MNWDLFFAVHAVIAVALFIIGNAIGVYEAWFIWKRDGEKLYTAEEWVGNVGILGLVAITPIANIVALIGTFVYFSVEHLPYIMRKE